MESIADGLEPNGDALHLPAERRGWPTWPVPTPDLRPGAAHRAAFPRVVATDLAAHRSVMATQDTSLPNSRRPAGPYTSHLYQ